MGKWINIDDLPSGRVEWDDLFDAPSIDIEPKRGEWKPFDLTWGRSIWYCTACEESTEVPTYLGTPMYNFCPMCGANMNMKKADECKTENSSEKPNNCEHITEDGVTCAKYPACDDCLDNPLNKLKGSERLLKGKDEPTISKMEQVDKDINVRSKDEPQTEGVWNAGYKTGYDKGYKDAQKVKDSQDLVKDLVKAFCEDGTWLERQGVYTLTLAEAKQRAVDIIESVLAKDEPTISKMEQVEGETQTPYDNCQSCLHWVYDGYWYCECNECRYEPQDEPQTEEHCNTCRHKDECEGATYEYKNTEWWCLGYAPIDEPQTDCAWK